jgi:hypothetical protein
MLKALTISEAAKGATITRRHFEALVSKGEGPVVINLGKRKIILEEDFDAWLRGRRQVKRKTKSASAPALETTAT